MQARVIQEMHSRCLIHVSLELMFLNKTSTFMFDPTICVINSYDAAGLAALVEQFHGLQPELIVLEATGGYEHQLVAELVNDQLPVVVINPRWVRNFARASGQLAKTDAIDATILSAFAEKMRPPIRPLPDDDLKELRGLLVRRRQIVDMAVHVLPLFVVW